MDLPANHKTYFCLGYEKDFENAYAFYCARYENIKYDDFMKLGYEQFRMKLSSIPESEPFYHKIKSRTINISKIKDKEERKYWLEQKRVNAIPDIYKSLDELEKDLKEKVKGGKWKQI